MSFIEAFPYGYRLKTRKLPNGQVYQLSVISYQLSMFNYNEYNDTSGSFVNDGPINELNIRRKHSFIEKHDN